MDHVLEVFYGGAAGGGKSDALLQAALQYVDVPGYAALILRKTWQDLTQPGAIMDRADKWLAPTPALKKQGGRVWEFPSGARLVFGYVMHHRDVDQYASAEYQFIGIDEVTRGWEERTYEFLFSRIRRPAIPCKSCTAPVNTADGGETWFHREPTDRCSRATADDRALGEYPSAPDGTNIFNVPLRMRTGANPGGSGHLWAKRRFVDPETREEEAVFVPAKLVDNPSLDRSEYESSLSHLGPVERQRMLNGDWDVIEEGNMFKRWWWQYVDREGVPSDGIRLCRYWDMAAISPKRALQGGSSDWVRGCLLALTKDGLWYLVDMAGIRGTPLEIERFVTAVTNADSDEWGGKIIFRMEQEGASSGVMTIDHYRRHVFVGLDFDSDKPIGDKPERASGPSSAAESGNLILVKGPWNADFVDEAELFPGGPNDDQIDAMSGAMKVLRKRREKQPARATTVARRRLVSRA